MSRGVLFVSIGIEAWRLAGAIHDQTGLHALLMSYEAVTCWNVKCPAVSTTTVSDTQDPGGAIGQVADELPLPAPANSASTATATS